MIGRIIVATIVAVFAVAVAHIPLGAEERAPVSADTLRFEFTAAEVNVIEAALNELPRKYSEPIIEKMRAQVVQQKAKTPAPAQPKAP